MINILMEVFRALTISGCRCNHEEEFRRTIDLNEDYRNPAILEISEY